ncbi:MAG TPA: hypothetical protein VK659_03860, partial [Asanoa sp.]|nr:hypothetical protein [Asanoa sp.]
RDTATSLVDLEAQRDFAGALVHGIGEIALGFQIHQGRRGITSIEGLADRLGVTNNHPAPDAAVSTR